MKNAFYFVIKVFLFLLIASFVIKVANKPDKKDSAKEPLTMDESLNAARYICREAIKGKLKDPDTARFDDIMDSKASYHDHIWRVSLKLWGKNSFGGFTRSTFHCDLMQDSYGNITTINIKENH